MTLAADFRNQSSSFSIQVKTFAALVIIASCLAISRSSSNRQLERNHIPSPSGSVHIVRTCAPIAAPSNDNAGITDKTIRIGSCCALTGPAGLLGTQLVAGAKAYFNFVNESGGINGRRIELITYDDGYDPARSIGCFNQLLKDNIFAGAFFVGTPTAAKYVPMAEIHQIPLVGLFTGAQFLHEPFRPHIISVRASYFDETKEQINNLWDSGRRKIAVIYQNDAYGAVVLKGVKSALALHSAAPIALGSFCRNTLDVNDAISQVRRFEPDAVIMAGPYAPLAEIVKRSHASGWKPLFLTVSFVGTESFIKAAGKDADGTVITQVVPLYSKDNLPTIALYKKLYKKYYPTRDLSPTSCEGFIDAMVMVDGLKLTGPVLTREKFLRAMESIHDKDMGLGPLKLSYGPKRHKGFDKVYATVVRNHQPVELEDWNELK